MLAGVMWSVAVVQWLVRVPMTFGAISAPPHISPQVTRETAMRVCTAEEHIAGHGPVSEVQNSAQIGATTRSAAPTRRTNATPSTSAPPTARQAATLLLGHPPCRAAA